MGQPSEKEAACLQVEAWGWQRSILRVHDRLIGNVFQGFPSVTIPF